MRSAGLLKATSAYGLSVVVSGVVSIAVIPAVIIAAGETAWVTIAVSQAVAGFAFVLAVFGWGVTGPTDVASRGSVERGRYFFESLLSRTWLSLIIVPISIPLSIILSRGDPLLAGLTTASGILVALGAGWFFVGEKSPIRFLVLDTAPRIIGTVAGAGVLLATGDARWFAGIQLAGVVAAAIISSASILRRYRSWSFTASPKRALRNLRGQAAPVTMAATTSLYVNVPIVIVQLFLPSATAVYALAERIVRLSLYATRPVVQIAQGYVPASEHLDLVARAKRVTLIGLVLGGAGGLAFAVLGPWVGTILSGGAIDLGSALAIAMGANLAALLASQLTGFACLTAFGLARELARSTIVGAIVGTVLMIPLTFAFGVVGLAWGLAISELAVLAVQLVALRRAFAAPPPEKPAEPVEPALPPE
ncbi:polysaccharide biosynthesis C-terminal domain-containing protein [Agromyces atrinae]|uniref:lipopolysaccharide biosynthesis protein n=1 Tax=Agromyces atrinae TaxID=592376 RepID=UPI001F57C0B9|nr:polysaccharide biosynthesis C-terminal domain-containing protein [Agromyces atrinae]MCI2958009.1 polysaccharide biosynthesis C-terminal domain-containing protein [Agromyces atrinae]